MSEARTPVEVEGPSILQDAVARLREEILSRHEPDTFLGSEEDLQARLGVSRPTLRQAARVLEHENLLTVRRGARGGLFTREPSADAVSHVASVYLRYQGTTHRDLHRADSVILPEVARLAALHPSAPERAALGVLARSPEHLARVNAEADVRGAFREFGLALIALVDVPPLALFYEMMLDLSIEPFPLQGLDAPALRGRLARFHAELADAIAEGESALAAALATAYLAETATWIP